MCVCLSVCVCAFYLWQCLQLIFHLWPTPAFTMYKANLHQHHIFCILSVVRNCVHYTQNQNITLKIFLHVSLVKSWHFWTGMELISYLFFLARSTTMDYNRAEGDFIKKYVIERTSMAEIRLEKWYHLS